MTTTKRTIALAFVLACAWAATSQAQEYKPLESNPDAAYKQADRNKNGGIDHAEFHHRMVEVFYFADGNRDGVLTGIEIARTGRENPAAGDSDGDGQLTMKEFMDEAFDRFEMGDADDDEELSLQEVREAYAQ